MLTYVIAFSIISLSDADPSIMGTYDMLVLSQITPGTAYFAYQNDLRNGGTGRDNVIRFLSNYHQILDPAAWVINRLHAVDSNFNILTECINPENNQLLIYGDQVPQENVLIRLSTRWPSFSQTEEAQTAWENNYNRYGSCIKPAPVLYFELAMGLLDIYNVGPLLRRPDINPGGKFFLDKYVAAIRYITNKNPQVFCAPAERDDEQLLVEVRICFLKSLRTADCPSNVYGLCHPNKKILYSGSTRN